MFNRVVVKDRVGRMSLRKCCRVWEEEVFDDFGENRFSGLEVRL